jgi:arylsulfatase A-like enzyme
VKTLFKGRLWKRRLALIAGLAICVTAHAASPSSPKGFDAAGKPNIVIIFNDDMGYADFGCFGSEKNKTPRIDKMAEEGRRFTSFYVASAVCSASRAALMTGRYPQNVGVRGVFFPNRPGGLDPEHFTIAELLKSAGYKTLAAGKWHLGDEPQYLPTNQGFDTYYGVPYSNDMYPAKSMKYADDCLYLEGMTQKKIKGAFAAAKEGGQPNLKNKVPLMRDEECIEFPLDQTTITRRIADESIRFIKESVKEGKPFFVYLANPMPHIPLFVSPEFEGKTGKGLYSDVIAEIDHNTGRVLDALKANGVDENTLVIFSSDNGPWLLFGDHGGSAKPLRDGKGSTYEGGQRVPTIMRWPAKIPAGTECAEMATAMDMMPTFAAITGARLPADLKLDGHNVLSLITGGADAKTPYKAFYFGNQGVRSGDWKYREGRRYGNWSTPRGQPKPKPNPNEKQLFNLAEDIGEKNNLSDKNPEVRERLKNLLDENRGKQESVPKKKSSKTSAAKLPLLEFLDCAPVQGTRYEAEFGGMSGGAAAGPSPAASGGKQVGSLHKPGAAVAFNVDGGANGGEFDFRLGYGSLKGATLTVDVNGVKQSARLPKTGGWRTYKAVRLSVTLKPGKNNRMEINCFGGNLDYFDLMPSGANKGS